MSKRARGRRRIAGVSSLITIQIFFTFPAQVSRMHIFAKQQLCVASIVAAVVLSACSSSTAVPRPPSAITIPSVSRDAQAGRPPAKGASWMRADTKRGALLYLADYVDSSVRVFTFPKGKLIGTLTGLNHPEGECVDAASNVWIANTGSSQIVEYAHGATKPSATLADPGYFPTGCAIDPKTGDLAVANVLTNMHNLPGNVALYKNASGTPSYYDTRDAGFYSVYFIAYDGKGNLFFDGTNGQPSDGSFIYGEVPKNSTNVKIVALDAPSIGFPGNVQWDGKHITVGDQDNAVVYQTKGSKVIGSTPLTGSTDVVGYAISGKTLVGPDTANSDAGFYSYPAGGSPQKTLGGFSDPIGAAISP